MDGKAVVVDIEESIECRACIDIPMEQRSGTAAAIVFRVRDIPPEDLHLRCWIFQMR